MSAPKRLFWRAHLPLAELAQVKHLPLADLWQRKLCEALPTVPQQLPELREVPPKSTTARHCACAPRAEHVRSTVVRCDSVSRLFTRVVTGNACIASCALLWFEGCRGGTAAWQIVSTDISDPEYQHAKKHDRISKEGSRRKEVKPAHFAATDCLPLCTVWAPVFSLAIKQEHTRQRPSKSWFTSFVCLLMSYQRFELR